MAAPKQRRRSFEDLKLVPAGGSAMAFAPSSVSKPGLWSRSPLPSTHDELLLSEGEWLTISSHLGLSVRESQVARLLLSDKTEAEIASVLSISPRTVHAHVERLYRRVAVHSRNQLVIRIFNAFLSCCAGRTIETA
jgi:DNA-binding CsgD family transcriptional regulator